MMANRKARRAREVARREDEIRMRRLLRAQKQTDQIDLTRTERRMLAQVCYVWSGLPVMYRNERTQAVCGLFRWLQQRPPQGMKQVYADAENMMDDVLRTRSGRRAVLHGGPYIMAALRKGTLVRNLDHWVPHRGRNLTKLLAQLVEEWCGAYRHQLPPVVRRQLQFYLNLPAKTLNGWGWEVVLDQLKGIPVHKSPVRQHMPVLSAAQVAMRRVPKHIYGLEAMVAGANLLALGTPRRIVRLLANDFWFYLKEESMLQSPLWRLYAENPDLSRHEVFNWFWEAYDWSCRMGSLELKPSPSAAYHILGYTLNHRSQDESESERNLWYAFCLEQLRLQGKQFRMLGRNEERLEQKFQTYRLQHLNSLREAEPEWEAASFPTLEQAEDDSVYRIEELRSAAALRLEGLLMQHCVESYVEACRKGACSIWSLRWYPQRGESTPLVTIELTPKGRINQAYAKCNVKPKSEWTAMIKAWKRTFE